jgi:plasmid stabilization system protein ParE
VTSVEITERAEADLLGFVDYLAEANLAVARDFIDAFERAVERLSIFPESGALLHDGGTGNERVALVYPARVIYRFEVGVVRILRVVHGARDLRRLDLS